MQISVGLRSALKLVQPHQIGVVGGIFSYHAGQAVGQALLARLGYRDRIAIALHHTAIFIEQLAAQSS